MNDKFTHVFDIDALGAQLGGRSVEVQGPGGHSMIQIIWTPALTEELRLWIKKEIAGDYSGEICHRGSAPMWVMAAALEAMYPASVTFTPPVAGVELKLHNLAQGEINPAGEVEFDVTRRGKTVYINYKADDPDKPQIYGGGHHSYNPELIPLVKAPVVAEEEHVCLSGNSAYNVTMSIASAYFSGCRSLSVMGAGPGGGADGYVCAVSHCAEKKLGDITATL